MLLEKSRDRGVMHGFTENYIRVEMPADAAADNCIVNVRLGDFNIKGDALKATLSDL